MKKIKSVYFILFIVTIAVFSCTSNKSLVLQSKYKAEIMQAEKDFKKLVAEKGLEQRFSQFADDDSVIKREHDTLIIGKNNIQKYYSKPAYKNIILKWTADHIEVSEAGDLGYT